MWLFTPTGFYSIVFKNPSDEGLTVRSRIAADLDRLRAMYLPTLSATIRTPLADYPFRATVAPEAMGVALARIAEDIDYSNFKDEIAQSLGDQRAAIYGRIWESLVSLEESERNNRPKRLDADDLQNAITQRNPATKRRPGRKE